MQKAWTPLITRAIGTYVVMADIVLWLVVVPLKLVGAM